MTLHAEMRKDFILIWGEAKFNSFIQDIRVQKFSGKRNELSRRIATFLMETWFRANEMTHRSRKLQVYELLEYGLDYSSTISIGELAEFILCESGRWSLRRTKNGSQRSVSSMIVEEFFSMNDLQY